MRLSIAVPSNRDHSAYFTASLVGLIQHMGKHGVEGRQLEWYSVNIKAGCSNLCNGRQELIDEAIGGGATHLLFLDDDMTFPYNMLDFLCRWDMPVIAANCCRKSPTRLLYTAFDDEGREIGSKGKTGMQVVSRVGTAVMLLNLAAVDAIPRPHFEMLWVPEKGHCRGEDFYFCRKLRDHRVDIGIDHDVSNNIGHLGLFNYRFDSYPD